jgi:hypothetical protein
VTDSARKWTEGDYLTHRFNPELGVGRITAVEGRALVVHFERTGKTLRIAASSDALQGSTRDSGFGIRDSRVRDLAGLNARYTSPMPSSSKTFGRLRSIRESGMGSFLGGRIRLFPHQLYVAERATATHPVRWLLA